ncbi:MAG: hypothetical protein HUJ13_11170 [Hydrogenovibrio crunogenus]|nr:hypothetical protein [Hydrogenovibrio crunogenus]
MGILVSHSSLTKPKFKQRSLVLTWFFRGYDFKAAFLKSEPIMKVSLLVSGQEIDSIEVPYSKKARHDKLYEDLQLRKVSDELIHQASNFGKIEGESVHSLLS